jgi:hypothetical protein
MLRRRVRPLAKMPEHDATIDGMDPSLRREVGGTWRRRAHEELKASMAFAVLSRELLEVGPRLRHRVEALLHRIA